MDKLDRHDMCRIRDDAATMLMAISAMKREIEESDLNEYVKKNMMEHYQHIIEHLNMIILIIRGATSPEEPRFAERRI